MKLKSYLRTIHQLSEKEVETGLGFFYPKELKKGEHYLLEGKYADSVGNPKTLIR